MRALQLERVKQIADTLLYEGHLLYPYRSSALKNQERWLFGRLYPNAGAGVDPWFMQCECLVSGQSDALIGVRVRFLQLTDSRVGQEPIEREIIVADLPVRELLAAPKATAIAHPPIEGTATLAAQSVEHGCYRLTLRIENCTAYGNSGANDRHAILLHTFLSTHAILGVHGGRFISQIDPPETLRAHAAACRNVGAWPVLAGDQSQSDMMLAAPIILYDYPRIAPESMGDLFDGTEIDEMLTLRIQTLTEQEKGELRNAGGRACAMLDRTERLSPDQFRQLHGATRGYFRTGSRVRLRPRGRSDSMDLILNGKTATIVSVEHDFEGRIHLAVVIDGDPGQDLGREGKPGHRFFFGLDEVESLEE